MNLQIITPIEGVCKMACPYCMASAHGHQNNFVNLYRSNPTEYFAKMRRVLYSMNINNIIITGTAEPQQELETLRNITQMLCSIKRTTSALELQTRVHKISNELSQLYDVVSFSIDDPAQIAKIKQTRAKIDRFVFILTDKFNEYSLQQLLNMGQFTPAQVTFKPLVTNNEIQCPQDEWVRQHSCNDATLRAFLYDINMHNYTGNISIRWDAECWRADNRYIVFREDGDLYDSWDDPIPAMRVTPRKFFLSSLDTP